MSDRTLRHQIAGLMRGPIDLYRDDRSHHDVGDQHLAGLALCRQHFANEISFTDDPDVAAAFFYYEERSDLGVAHRAGRLYNRRGRRRSENAPAHHHCERSLDSRAAHHESHLGRDYQIVGTICRAVNTSLETVVFLNTALPPAILDFFRNPPR